MEEAGKNDLSGPQLAALAEESYWAANAGLVAETWGMVFPWCPRWFAVNASPWAIITYNGAVAALRRAEAGLSVDPLTAFGEDFVLGISLQRERLKVEMAKKKAED